MQVKVDNNVYFSQMGNKVIGSFVNNTFIELQIDKQLDKMELQTLAEDIYKACLSNSYIREHLGKGKEYSINKRESVLNKLNENKTVTENHKEAGNEISKGTIRRDELSK